MTNCYKRMLQKNTKEFLPPLLIDKWQIATKEYKNNTFTTTNR